MKNLSEKNTFAVIMAGGRGERFWPLSRAARPKQLLDIFGGKALLAHAIERLTGVVSPERTFVITSTDLAEKSRKAAPSLPPENIICEPLGRDTAAACALATEIAGKIGGEDAIVAILTADHIMTDEKTFKRTLSDAFVVASKTNSITTIGIKPSFPATGFGYIESGDILETGTESSFRKANRFVEKPDAETANRYLAGGKHFWNSGMFIWSVSTFRTALGKYAPELANQMSIISDSIGKHDFDDVMKRVYPLLKKISVDYAVMEHADNIVMAEGEFGWDDVGSWNALPNQFPADNDGNVTLGECVTLDSKDNIVYTDNGHIIALCGVSDMVVVHTKDATMVCPRSQVQRMKELVKAVSNLPDGKSHI